MKMREIIEKEVCGIKSQLMGLNSSKGKSYYNSIALKNIFKKYELPNLTEKIIEEELEEALKGFKFNTSHEKIINSNTIKNRLMQFKAEEEALCEKNLSFIKGDSGTVNIDGIDIVVDYDFIKINKDTNIATIYKLKNSSKTIKRGGKTKITKLSENKELFLLFKLLNNMFPSYNCYSSIIFLKELELKGTPKFKLDTYCATTTYDTSKISELELEVADLIKDTSKTCSNKSSCSMCSYLNICSYNSKDYTGFSLKPTIPKAPSKVTFTDAQEEFINVEKGVYRILAGAGSGKTTVIANNVVNLVKKGVRPQDILLITFTNKGVEELKEKIFYWLSENKLDNDMSKFKIFTFNSYGYEIIKKEYEFLGFTEEPSVIEKVERFEILKNILDKYPIMEGFNYEHPFMDLFNAKGVVIEVLDIFDNIKKYELTLPEELKLFYDYKDKVLEQILIMNKEYNELLKSKNLIEFNDQVPMAYRVLSEDKFIKKYGVSHIICDEFQDSDVLQINLLKLLYDYKYCQSLCVCGDDSQSIFSWRGADRNNIVDFNNYFDNVQDIKMVQNFRSTDKICKLANIVNKQDTNGVKKEIYSDKVGKKPLLKKMDLTNISREIEEYVKLKGVNPSRIAFISRKRTSLLKMDKLLNNLSIPSVVSVPELLIENPKVKNLINFSKFLLDNSLDVHFAEYLQVIKTKDFDFALENNTLYKFIEEEKKNFLAKYNSLSDDLKKLEFIYSILSELSKEDDAIKQLLTIIIANNFKDIKSLVDYLNKLIIYKADNYVSNENNYDAVTLITAHSSKGKEYDIVFLELDGFSSFEANKEELRLLFVAITRAKEELIMFSEKENFNYKNIKKWLGEVS
ncbi:MAG: ATP-dependent helicase [Clostridiales bacterium]|nr:ATP-dependent helicase [Clostridiales bacterium]